MRFKVSKIVYGYDLVNDRITAIEHYVPCADDDPHGSVMAEGDPVDVKRTVKYTPQEWDNLLYWIRSHNLSIRVVKALDEVTP